MAFRDVVGHGALIRLVSRAAARDTLPASLLLSGPAGVGKRLVAVALAQAQNCPETGPTDQLELDACGVCPVCRRIAGGNFPDVQAIEPGENGSIVIEPIRQAVGEAAYRPFEGRRRVVIVDDADRLVAPAQNALLKTLEEPPAASQFVLVTPRPDMLLATVRSRCQRLSFGPLSMDDVATVLGRESEGTGDLRVAAAASGGSVGRARALATGELSEARQAALGLLRSVAAGGAPRARLDSARAFAGKRPGAAGRQDLRRRLEALLTLLRDVALLGAGGETRALANLDVESDVTRLTDAFAGERARRAFGAVDEALQAVEANVGPKVVADWLACRL